MRLICQGCNYRQQDQIFQYNLFLSWLPCNLNQRLYMLRAVDYSAFPLWCFPRCRSNLFFFTVQHIMGVCESCLSRSSALVTVFQVGCSPSPLHHSLLLFFFMLLFTHLSLSPLFYAWYLSSSWFPLGSCIVQLPTPYLSPADRALYLLRLCPIRRAALWVMGVQIPLRSPHLSSWWNLLAWERQSWSPLSKESSFLLLCLEVF